MDFIKPLFCLLIWSVLALLPHLTVADRSQNPTLIDNLRMGGTQLDRLDLLPSDANDWTFDFHAQKGYSFSPASVVTANTANFPTVIGNKLSVAMIQLGPCGMLPPHFHPRAANYVLAVAGETHTYAIEENDARIMATVLTPGKMTIFPQGAIHTMMNRACEPAQLVSALSDEDQGTTNLLNNLFRLPEDFVQAAFGWRDMDVNETGSRVPKIGFNGVPGAFDCYAACNITLPDGYGY